MDVYVQRRIAADILKCGVDRVWIDPERLEDVKAALSRDDIRELIKKGVIRKLQKKGISSARVKKLKEQRKKGRRRGPGSRRGAAGARNPPKEQWMMTVRALRKLLKQLRDEGKIEKRVYRKLYRMAKGGFFRSKSHLMLYIEEHELIKQ